MAGEEDAAEDGGGWDVGDELELPTDLVSHTYIITCVLNCIVSCCLLCYFFNPLIYKS